MSSRLNGFNAVAPFYDRLAAFIYGKSIREAQTYFLKGIPPASKIIILGGGTGWILNVLFRIQPDCRVWYIDASSSMIAMATKGARAFQERITFIHGTEDDIPGDISADYVLASFFLDLFTPANLKNALDKIYSSLAASGTLLVTDFVDRGKLWQRTLLKMMYLFFKITSGMGSMYLPPWEEQLGNSGLQELGSSFFFYGFIKSVYLVKRQISE